MRGFAIDASVPVDIAQEAAVRAERDGYASFWVNGSPPQGALDIIERAATHTELDIGVGVFPLTSISADELVTVIRRRALPQERLWLGIGSGRPQGGLAEIRQAVHTLRAGLDTRIVMGAVGPRMTVLAGQLADAVIFTWWTAEDVERSRVLLEQGAATAERHEPTVAAFIRCALLPQAAEAVAARAAVYDAIPRYREIFERTGRTAADRVITGTSRSELLAGIEREEAALDISIIRAIPAADTIADLAELAAACAP